MRPARYFFVIQLSNSRSVMTFYRIREKNLKKLMEKNPVLYIKE